MITPAMHLGHYGVVAPIDAGGMGRSIARAMTKLQREVAIAILSASLAADPAALAQPNSVGDSKIVMLHVAPDGSRSAYSSGQSMHDLFLIRGVLDAPK